MSWDKIVNGDFGQVGELTLIDVDTNAAADVSSYTTAQVFLLTDPDAVTTTKTAAFVNTGSDGKVDYTLVSGDIDQAGEWMVRARVTSGTAQLTSEELRFEVLA